MKSIQTETTAHTMKRAENNIAPVKMKELTTMKCQRTSTISVPLSVEFR